MISLEPVDIIGYIAGALVLATFYLQTMLKMRMVAIFSNIAFITYGALTHAVPVLVLHTLLLPLNVTRLLQMRRLIRRIVFSAHADKSLAPMIPFMKTTQRPANTVLFAQDDPADTLYYVVQGQLTAVKHKVDLGPGSVIGEIGVFMPAHKRSDTIICKTDVELGSISAAKARVLFFEHPEFAAYLVRIISERAARAIPESPAPPAPVEHQPDG
jgi:CRP/FNR family transcriptional regulator, cyclic AMP receptor protein